MINKMIKWCFAEKKMCHSSYVEANWHLKKTVFVVFLRIFCLDLVLNSMLSSLDNV